MVACVTTLLKGLSEIRVFGKSAFVTKEFNEKVQDFMKNSILVPALDSWYMNHVNFLNVFLVLVPGFILMGYFMYYTENSFPI